MALAKIAYIDGCERAGRQVGEMFVGRDNGTKQHGMSNWSHWTGKFELKTFETS